MLTAERTGAGAPIDVPARTGTVYLIGAGPGAPDLITVKGLRCLRAADVVVYDRLVDPALLDGLRPEAERIYVGKGPRCHTTPQSAINALLVRYARRGMTVARLKGGDPFVFGRGGEEALALAAEGIPFEIIPGVSSAIAAPAYAGIPVTHRGLTTHFTVVTGHTGREASSDAAVVDWRALTRVGGTLVILMGVEALSGIAQRLLDGGLSAATPAAVIQEAASARQRGVAGTLADIATRVAAAGVESPAVIVVGEVAALHQALAWCDSESLTNRASSEPHLFAPDLRRAAKQEITR
jgi:uroporphyrin-III C-methyltransferase